MTERKSTPIWFWIVTIIALLWNLLGMLQFIVQVTMSPEDLAAYPEDQQAIYKFMPSWVNIAFALAVFGGVFGCIALLMRKSWAIPMFIVSLIGVIAHMYYIFFMSNSYEIFGPNGLIQPITVIVVAILLLALAKMAKAKSWIH